jgi:hypothetical protein
MDNHEDKGKEENSQSPKNEQENEIPLWLQGLDDSETNNEPGNPKKEEPVNQWVKEVDKDTSSGPISTEKNDAIDHDLPEWLDAVSEENNECFDKDGIDQTLPEEKFHNQETFVENMETGPSDQQSEDEVELINEEPFETSDESKSEPQEEKGFIEIEESEFEKSFSNEEINSIELKENDEDLPEWLKEMIGPPLESHEEPLSSDNSEAFQSQDEPTKPIEVRSEEQPFSDEEPAAESMIEIKSSEEEPREPEIPDLPEELLHARTLLDDQNVSDAANVFDTYIQKGVHIQTIKSWLQEYIKDDTDVSSHVWELLGDIATKEEKSTESLAAYSQAIQTLLLKEAKNEND